MFFILEIIVKIIGYSAVLYGLWRLIGHRIILKTIKLFYFEHKRSISSKRLRLRKVKINEPRTRNFLHQHIRLLILSVSKNPNVNVANFYIFTFVIFYVSFILVYFAVHDLMIALIFGLVLMMFPYIILRMKLITQRLNTSFAFLENFHIIAQSYYISGSAYHMIMNIIKELNNKELKQIFMKLLSNIQQDGSEEGFKEAIQIFTYSINSSFAIRFGNLLTKAHLYHTDISLPIKDLSNDVTIRKNDIETEKSKMVEFRILGYLPIITLPVFVLFSKRISMIYDYWNLFMQKTPITIFLIAVLFSIGSLFGVIIFTKPRSDI